MSIKNAGTREEVQFLASPALKTATDMHAPMNRMADFKRSKTAYGGRMPKEIVEALPDWHVSMAHKPKEVLVSTSEAYYQDYMFMRDNNIFDLTGRIRKRFASSKRCAQGNAPAEKFVRQLEAGEKVGERRSLTRRSGVEKDLETKPYAKWYTQNK